MNQSMAALRFGPSLLVRTGTNDPKERLRSFRISLTFGGKHEQESFNSAGTGNHLHGRRPEGRSSVSSLAASNRQECACFGGSGYSIAAAGSRVRQEAVD